MPNNSRKTIFTTISIDKETAALVEKNMQTLFTEKE